MELPPEKRAELINFVNEARTAKKKDKEIRQLLLNAGWVDEVIMPVLIETRPKSRISPASLTVFLLAVVSFTVTGIIIYLALR